ncbi:ABC transporter ATP-binding protein, partial [Streptomyces sp. NPDC006658]
GGGRRATALMLLHELPVAEAVSAILTTRPRPSPHARPARHGNRAPPKKNPARALAAGPQVLFADEPTAPLHRADRAHVLRTLTTAARSHGITVVLATHDPDTAALADRTVALLDGRRVHTVHLPDTPDAEGRAACSLSV